MSHNESTHDGQILCTKFEVLTLTSLIFIAVFPLFSTVAEFQYFVSYSILSTADFVKGTFLLSQAAGLFGSL
jgi:hypothetical protein